MFDLGFGILAFFCVGSSGFPRKISILDDFGAKRKKEGLPAAKHGSLLGERIPVPRGLKLV